MSRKPKETLRDAGSRKPVEEVGEKPMGVQDKIRILAYALRGMGKKEISSKTGYPMDWIATIMDVFQYDSEFCVLADKLNSGGSIAGVEVEDGLGGAKRG